MDTRSTAPVGKPIGALLLLSVTIAVFALTYQWLLPASIVKYAVAAALACIGGLWVLANPVHGLFFAVFYIYAGVGYYFDVPAGYPFVVIALVGALIKLWQDGRLRTPSSGFNIAVAFFTLIAVTSMLWAHFPDSSLHGLSIWLKSLFLVYLIVHLLRTPRDVERFATVLFVGALAAVFLGLANIKFGWIKQERLLEDLGWIRFTATHEDPNETAVLFGSTIPIGVYLIRRTGRWLFRIPIIVGLLMVLLAAFATLSRGAIFPIGFVILLILVRELGRNALIPICVAALLIAVAVPPVYWERLTSLDQLMSGVVGDFSLLNRLMVMKAAWYAFLAHPLTGIGLENIAQRSATDVVLRIPAHNAYLDVLSGVGIFGFIAYMSGLGSVYREFKNAFTARWREEDQHLRHLAFYMFASVATVLVGAMFLTIWHVYYLWIPIAAILAIGRVAREQTAS